jgi:molybdopterin-guanine dinucleotide biosynthesis protein A
VARSSSWVRPGQLLPALPAGVAVVQDPVEGLGPMQGIAAGLAAVADRAATAFVCSTGSCTPRTCCACCAG